MYQALMLRSAGASQCNYRTRYWLTSLVADLYRTGRNFVGVYDAKSQAAHANRSVFYLKMYVVV